MRRRCDWGLVMNEDILGNYIEVVNGFAFKSKNFVSEPNESLLPVIKIKNVANGDVHLNGVQYHILSEQVARYIIGYGDILLALTGNHPHAMTQVVGEASRYKLNIKALLNQRVAKIEPKDGLDRDYLYYFLKDDATHNYLASKSSGSANQANISKQDIESLEFRLLPLPEQKAIAEVLSSLDDKIDLLHRQNKTLEQMAETLFRQRFVEEAGEDWEFTSFEKWVGETIGGEWGKETPQGDFTKTVICIRGTDIADLNKGLARKAPLRFVKVNKFEKIEPQPGDIIIEISGGTEKQSTGRTTYINDDVKSLFQYPLIFSNFSRLIKIKNLKFSFFTYLYFQYLYKRNEFFNLENGSSGIKNLDYKTLLYESEFLMPTEGLVIEFNDNIESIFEKINKNKFQLQTLEKLRDSLLPKLMNGEVRIEING